ncbi:hypothetical protein [Streptomyces sp. NPDC015350]|uniref:hypothetical protein n=1 Tax=Streptomyces sp. NPDC015350 TaxID=3364955 RepID=UPI0036F7A929
MLLRCSWPLLRTAPNREQPAPPRQGLASRLAAEQGRTGAVGAYAVRAGAAACPR